MTITPQLFEAFLECPTKCWLRAADEQSIGNIYAEWFQAQNESYRAAETKRLLMETPPSECIQPPRSSRGQPGRSIEAEAGDEALTSAESLKSAKWRMAADILVRTPELPHPTSRSSRRQEAPSEFRNENDERRTEPHVIAPATSDDAVHDPNNLKQTASQSLLTSAATHQETQPAWFAESRLHAVKRVPSEGRGKAAQFIPIRFIFANKLGKDERLLLAFDAFVLSETLGREVNLGKIIHGDLRGCARSSRGSPRQSKAAAGNEAQISSPALEACTKSQSLLTSAATSRIGSDDGTDKPPTKTLAAPAEPQSRITKVKTSALAGEVRKRLEKITALLASPAPPDLVLNRHCAECEFQARCRKIALEKDDLILLANMSAKERLKLRGKGIFTVTQLSYTFRPRRRPKRMCDKREKYHHSLKALAIREKKIHIVGSPKFEIEGTPVYLDVEGLPDRDFYYLIGVRIGNGESAVQHSLWADTVADEGKIWREFLGILETVEKPVLIHYGSYETTFLKRMENRHGSPLEGSLVATAMASAINVVSVMFAQTYFPTYSNGLKEVAGWIGFKWSEAGSVGTQTICWRENWHQGKERAEKQKLIVYNADDCAALACVCGVVLHLGRPVGTSEGGASRLDVTKADDLSLSDTMWPTFSSSIPGFEAINKAARWNYQRDRIYVRTDKVVRRAVHGAKAKSSRSSSINKESTWSGPLACPGCGRTGKNVGTASRVLYDLRFSKHGMRTWVTRHDYDEYHCGHCHCMHGKPEVFLGKSMYGRNVVGTVAYMLIELCMTQRSISSGLNRMFRLGIHEREIHRLKGSASRFYELTRKKILARMVNGGLIHADETSIVLKRKRAYVWVFASLREVVYFYAESREGDILDTSLNGFTGVLISDFYAAYDSVPCQQQKCLIHLMRDLNDAVLNNPYDEEVRGIVTWFASLLNSIVQTIDRRGLKRHFLRKHLADVKRFYRQFSRTTYQTETALKLKERFEKNRDKLFTFLNHDGVPWNNNNAEHAIKAFARLRRTIEGISTPKGVEEYLILLSVCQTCKYMGVDFLDFLRSGEKDIHAFAESRRGRRRRSSTSG